MSVIHRSRVGTYHPAPCSCEPREQIACVCGPTWTINDTRGSNDFGPACDECGACECPLVTHEFLFDHKGNRCESVRRIHKSCCCGIRRKEFDILDQVYCVGLSFAYVCLDGGESLCEECATKAGIEIVECDCK